MYASVSPYVQVPLCVENKTHKGTLYVIFDTEISWLVCPGNKSH